MSKAVTESDKGTMAEAKGSSAPEAEVKTPDEVSKVSPKEEKVEEKPTLTVTQHEALIHMATSEAGRLQKAAETERDGFKTRAEKAEALAEDIQAERDRLQTDIEGLTNDDPKKFDLVKRDKELRDAQRTLQTATDDLATEAKAHEETVKIATDTMLEIAIWDIATEYEGGDPVILKNLCATLGVTTEEKAREVAGNLWEKAEEKVPAKKGESEGEVKEKLSLDPGGSHGVGEKTEQEKLDERFPSMKGK